VFLGEPPESPLRRTKYDGDIEEDGFVWTLSKLWAWNPEADQMFGELLGAVAESAGLSYRDRGFVVASAASTMENSGCALAWGNRLSSAAGVDIAVSVLNGLDTDAMTPRERALSHWARTVAGDPASSRLEDVQELRDVGFDDRAIFSLTLYIGLRLAFSAVNDALDAPLDRRLVETFDESVVKAVDFGRPSV
jgi:alkylhydroperoxidase family enzyme